MIKNSNKSYAHYHRLLITFSNAFDQIFCTLNHQMHHDNNNNNNKDPMC